MKIRFIISLVYIRFFFFLNADKLYVTFKKVNNTNNIN